MTNEQNLPPFKRYQFLAFVGILLSLYLLYHHVELRGGFQTSPSFCSVNQYFDCDKVASSAYSEILGIPVAVFSLFYFLFIFSSFFLLSKNSSFRPDARHRIVFLFSLLSFPPSLIMLAISAFVIKSFCLFCSFLYLISFLLVGLSFYFLKKETKLSDFFKVIAESLEFSVNLLMLFLFVFFASISYALPYVLTEYYFVPRKKSQTDQVILKLSESMQGIGVSKDDVPLDILVLSDDFMTSSPKAPVQIIEFMDYQCPACQMASGFLKTAVEKYGDKVNLVIKNYPLDSACNKNISRSFHEYACLAASTAICAGGYGKERFWDMHEAIFSLEEFNSENLSQSVKKIGIEDTEFSSCVENPATLERIKRDISLGEKLRLSSTPTIYLHAKGKLIRGITVQMLDSALEVLLAE